MGSGFGIYTIALLVIAYPVLSNFQRLLNQSLLQQTLFIGLLVLVKRAIVYQLEHVLNDAVFNLPYLYPVLTSMVAWPWVYLLLRKYRRRYVIR
jgi:rod shape-determining protein MreD